MFKTISWDLRAVQNGTFVLLYGVFCNLTVLISSYMVTPVHRLQTVSLFVSFFQLKLFGNYVQLYHIEDRTYCWRLKGPSI